MNSFTTILKAEMVNYAGFNVYRHTKDPSERKRQKAIMYVIAVLLVMAVAYIAGAAYALRTYRIGRAIPMLYPALAMALTFMFGLFKSRGNLYRAKDRELMASLPVRSLPVASARLAKMYIEGVIVTVLVLVPAFLVYAVGEHPGAKFWIFLLPAILVLPILPVALAAWVGIVFSALIARVRHKVLAEVLLAVLVVLGTLSLSVVFSGGSAVSINMSDIMKSEDGRQLSSKEMNDRIAEKAAEAFAKIEEKTPFTKTWGSWFAGDKPAGIGILAAVSIAVFALTLLVIGRNLFSISAKLTPMAAHRDYKITELRSRSVTEALLRKEAGRYFASGLYVSNTIIGPVIVVALSVALAFFNIENLFGNAANLPFEAHPTAAFPFLIGAVFCMMSPSSASISIEGKSWWVIRSLPIGSEAILNAKLLFSMIVTAPFYCLSEVILLFTMRVGLLQRVWLLLVPLVYCIFSATWGLFVNLKFPKLKWETETEIVKQSAAVFLSILSLFAALLPGVAVLMLPSGYSDLVTAILIVVVAAVTYRLYMKIRSTDLMQIGG